MKTLFTTSIATFAASLAFGQIVSQSADITADTTWGDDESQVVLEGAIFVKNGATLTILPGTIVRGQPRTADSSQSPVGDPGSLIITQDGFINAAGSASAPIIFTTAAIDNDSNGIPDGGASFKTAWTMGDTFYDADPANSPLGPVAAGNIPGATGQGLDANVELWGGLIVLGNAPTNLGVTDNPTAKVGNIEGLPASADSQYGGNITNDNSGVIRYVSIRHGGDVLGSANEINGLTLGGVGNGTTLEFIEVYMNWDDGIEWFGGTVNGSHLHVAFAGDDQFDGDQGWVGQNQFLFGVLPYFAVGSSSGDEGFEFDGDDSDRNVDLSGVVTPFPNYSVYNATLVGSEGATGTTVSDNGRIELKSNYSGDIFNTIVVNTGALAGIAVNTGNPVQVGYSTFDDVAGSTASVPAVTNGTDNVVNSFGFNGLIGEDQAVMGGLDPRPALAFSGVVSVLTVPAGYEQVTYRGAFDPNAVQLWTTGWTVLNTLGVLVD
jgi:hypothetical protein